MINAIIFSKDRSCQLHLLLRSIEKNAPGIFKLNIIFKSSNESFEEGYKILQQKQFNLDLNWIKETSFKNDVLGCFDSSEYICFFTDDDILFRTIEEKQILEPLKNEEVFCFSLRLGKNTTECYTMKAKNILHEPEETETYITWDWSKHYLDFGYPLSVDGHIFRKKDIFKMIKKTLFTNPNTLESELQVFDNFPRNLMTSFKHNVLVNSPTNVVQEVYENRNGEIYGVSTEELNQRFLRGEFIDLNLMDFNNIVGCHQELEYKFKN